MDIWGRAASQLTEALVLHEGQAASSGAVEIDSSFLATGGSASPFFLGSSTCASRQLGACCCVGHERLLAFADWSSSARLDGHVGCGWMVQAASSTRKKWQTFNVSPRTSGSAVTAVRKYGVTTGCKACSVDSKQHNTQCPERFLKVFKKADAGTAVASSARLRAKTVATKDQERGMPTRAQSLLRCLVQQL